MRSRRSLSDSRGREVENEVRAASDCLCSLCSLCEVAADTKLISDLFAATSRRGCAVAVAGIADEEMETNRRYQIDRSMDVWLMNSLEFVSCEVTPRRQQSDSLSLHDSTKAESRG